MVMNNRYLFRGKRLDNGEWAEGLLFANKFGKHYILPYEHYGSIGLTSSMYVDPATVGQCTGLKDKNGKPVFEGDILVKSERSYTIAIIAKWQDGGWCCGGVTACQYTYRADSYTLAKFEVIGNVHDSPELLEVLEK